MIRINKGSISAGTARIQNDLSIFPEAGINSLRPSFRDNELMMKIGNMHRAADRNSPSL